MTWAQTKYELNHSGRQEDNGTRLGSLYMVAEAAHASFRSKFLSDLKTHWLSEQDGVVLKKMYVIVTATNPSRWTFPGDRAERPWSTKGCRYIHLN